MRISHFTVGHFKGIGLPITIPIRPITLLFGANGAGKSSIIHALLLCQNALQEGHFDLRRKEFPGAEIDLGGFRNYQHRHTSEPVTFGFRFNLTEEERTDPYFPSSDVNSNDAPDNDCFKHLPERFLPSLLNISYRSIGITVTVGLPKHDEITPANPIPQILSSAIAVDDLELLTLEATGAHTLRLASINHTHPFLCSLCASTWCAAALHQKFALSAFGYLLDAAKSHWPDLEPLSSPPRNLENAPPIKFSSEQRELLASAMTPQNFPGLDWRSIESLTKAGADIFFGSVAERLGNDKIETRGLSLEQNYANDLVPGNFHHTDYPSNESHAHVSHLETAVRHEADNYPSINANDIGKGAVALVSIELQSVLENVFFALRQELDHLSYLGPLRPPPRRIVELRTARESAQFRSTNTAPVGENVTAFANHLLTEVLNFPYRLEARNAIQTPSYDELRVVIAKRLIQAAVATFDRDELSGLHKIESEFARGIASDEDLVSRFMTDPSLAHVIDKLEISGAISELQKRLHRGADPLISLVDIRNGTYLSPADVGFGLSQVLPIISECLRGVGCVTCIEQPELHLHPALQARLADVFLRHREAAFDAEKWFILETHSEHLILRLLRRVREAGKSAVDPDDFPQPLSPSDISVVYLSAKDGATTCTLLPVTADGDFDGGWPDGFFEERFSEYPD